MNEAPRNEGSGLGRDAKTGRFTKGHKFSPGGTPGLRHRATRMAEKLFADDLKGITEVVVREAKAAAPWACRLVVGSLIPPPKGRPVMFELAAIKGPADIPLALLKVAEQMSAGEITPAEAAEIAAVFDAIRASFETAALSQRIDELQRQVAELGLSPGGNGADHVPAWPFAGHSRM
jgi:hypothetical protein